MIAAFAFLDHALALWAPFPSRSFHEFEESGSIVLRTATPVPGRFAVAASYRATPLTTGVAVNAVRCNKSRARRPVTVRLVSRSELPLLCLIKSDKALREPLHSESQWDLDLATRRRVRCLVLSWLL